jgi:subtilisin family serine protease
VPVSQTGGYIVVMKADPLVADLPTDQLDTPAADAQAAQQSVQHDAVLAESGVDAAAKGQEYHNALNGFAVSVSHQDAVKIAANPDVAVVMADELRQPTATDDTTSWGSLRVQRGNLYRFLGLTADDGPWRNGITGEGVVVGVIDTGIWPEHPSFADDGSYPAHEPLDESVPSCNFGNTAANPNDAAFECNNKLIGAREFLDTYKENTGLNEAEFDSARDDDGHGTHTASTAAGNAWVPARVLGRYVGMTSGIAPRAQIIAYKALGDGGGYTSDLVAAIDQAVADGVDVINYSIGGGAQTVSPDTLSFLFAADAGVFSAVSAGNDGPGASTIGGPSDVPWVTGVGANTQPRFYNGVLRLADGTIIRGASITGSSPTAELVDGADAGSELCLEDELDPAAVAGKIVLCLRGGNGRVAKSAEVARAGGVGMILFNATDDDTLFSDTFFVPTVMLDNTPGVQIKDWIAANPGGTGRIESRLPGLAPFYTPTMASFSSRGENPTAGDIIKPDVTAPGVQILAGATPFPTPGEQVDGQLFQAIAGTSMSSPVVAGEYALLKQAHPDWTPAMAKSALMTTAYTKVRDNDRVSQAGPFAMGAGMALVGSPLGRGSAFNPGIVYDAGFDQYLGFLCAEGREAFDDPDVACAGLAAQGIQTRAADLNYPSIGVEAVPGSTSVTRTVTSVADRYLTFWSKVEAPAGYSVEVSPAIIRLAPGASATFTVTITNTGAAPADEWRFGSLTWTSSRKHGGGGFAVRSPIAVKGVRAEVTPSQITGTGTSGSAELGVSFGYDGAYSAQAHGLAAPTVTNTVISQDPDQTYPSADDSPAGVVEVPVTITDAAMARWSLVLPGDDDLDLYLLDSNGDIVDASTNGGTNELIELRSPADGDYTLVVHGWAVAEDNTPFTLDNWVVPNAAGSLSITSGADTTAAIGQQHTVVVGWSGLTPGVEYLGVVSHHDDDGQFALTPVEVTG